MIVMEKNLVSMAFKFDSCVNDEDEHIRLK